VTVGAGGTSTITFSSIPSTYQHLQLRIFGRGNTNFSDGLSCYTTLNSDTGNNYSQHSLRGNGSSVFVAAVTSNNNIPFSATIGDTGATSTFGVLIIDLLDYANTSKYKTLRALSGYDRNGAGNVSLQSGLWMSTNATTSISMSTDGNWLQYTQAALYGIKG
jgi:hypothetical protein